MINLSHNRRDDPNSRVAFDRIIEWLLIGLLSFMPVAFGVVHAWSELVVVSLAGMMAVCLVLRCFRMREVRFVWSWSYLLIGAILLLVAFQLLPLPVRVMDVLSAETVSVRKELLGDAVNRGDALDNPTLSFYPQATRHGLRLLLVAAVVFVTVVNVFRESGQVKRLLGAVVLIGGAMAALALGQDIFGNGKIFWIVPTVHGTANAGSFVHHSHFGQFMNLSIGAAVGLLMILLHERGGIKQSELPAYAGPLSAGGKSKKSFIPFTLPEITSSNTFKLSIGLLAVMIIAGAIAVVVSLSRGAIFSMLIAAVITVLVVAGMGKLKRRGWFIMVLVLAVVVGVVYIGFDAVYDRLGSLKDGREYRGRWEILANLTKIFTSFPVFGIGLGGYEMVYPMYDKSLVPVRVTHAENDYAEILAELGLAGLILLLILIVRIGRCYVHCIGKFRTTGRAVYIGAVGMGFSLIAVLMGSLTDFGQRLPGNFCLTAVMAGLLVGMVHREKTGSVGRGHMMKVGLALAGVLLVGGWVWQGAYKAYAAEWHWDQAQQMEKSVGRAGGGYPAVIKHAAAAVRCEPGDVKYRYGLNVYRWREVSDLTLNEDAYAKRLRQIVADLHQTRICCPAYGLTYCLLGQLQKYELGEAAGAEHIRKGYRLSPNHPIACYAAGVLEVKSGREEEAQERLSRYVRLGGGFRDVLDIYLPLEKAKERNRPDLAYAVAGDNPLWLIHLSHRLSKTKKESIWESKARERALLLLHKQCDAGEASADGMAHLAYLYAEQKELDGAIRYFRRALELQYDRVDWRLMLARMLAEKNCVAEAVREVRICLRLQPQWERAEDMIAELMVDKQ